MKVKNKYKVFIVLTLFILVTTLFSINKVFGIGLVSHAWIDESRGERKLLFREFTAPTASNVEGYHYAYKEGGALGNYTYNGGTYTSMWAYEGGNYVRDPGVGTFNTVGFVFHTGQIGYYPESSNGTFAYSRLVNGASLDESIDSVNNAISNTQRIRISKPNEIYVSQDSLIANSYYFYRILHNSYTEGTANWNKNKYGTSLKTSMTASGLWASGRNTAYRYAVINRDGINIIISDWGIYGDQIQELKNAAVAQGIGSGGTVWVSNILITKHEAGLYELLKTGASYANAWGSSSGPVNWGNSRGLSDSKGLGAALNLFDNQIVLPVTDYRTVLVRHINVDTNTVISESIVNNATKIVESDNGIYYDGSTRSSNIWYGWDSYYHKYDKIAEVGKPVTVSALSPNANRKLSDGNTLPANGYYVLGYNIGQSIYSEDDARSIVNAKARQGSKETYWGPITINSSNTKDYVVVDFYYSTYAGDAEVSHVMLDSSNNIMEKQDINSNSTAVLSNKKTIKNLYKDSNSSYYNTSKKNSEIYRIPLKNTLTARKVSDKEYSKKDNKSYEYVGYSLSEPGTYVNPAMLNKGEATNISPNQTVTFYYRQIVEKIIEPEPERNIGGILSWDATGEDKLSTSCVDEERNNLSVSSVPSGSNVKFGITDISKFMVGAINSKHIQTRDTTLNASVVLMRGDESETYNYSVNYAARYFVITDLLVYRLSNIELYNTGSGYDGTRGEKLFDWNDGTSNISPTGNTDVTKIFELYGRNGLISTSNIENISNYVSSAVYDKSGVRQSSGPSTVTYTKTLLTTSQINEVDADRNTIINEADRTYATNHLNSLYNIFRSAQTELSSRETAYNQAVEIYAEMETQYRQIETTWNTKSTIYDNAAAISLTLYNSYNEQIREYNNKVAIYDEAQSDYQNKVNIYNEKLSNLEIYEQDVNESNEQLANLKAIYDDASDTLSNMDAELANCKNVAVYEEDCNDLQTARDNYFRDVFEVARLNYENYLNGENKNIIAIRDNYIENDVKDARDEMESAYANLMVEKNNVYMASQSVSLANKAFTSYRDDYYTPAKNDYESYDVNTYQPNKIEFETYRDVTLPGIEDEYSDYRDGEYATAETNYNSYNTYRTNLESNYPSYKALYDDYSRYATYSANQLASELELKAEISVQNMRVNMKDVDKNTSTTILSTEVETRTIPLSNIPSDPVFVEAQSGIVGSEEDQAKVNSIYGSIERNPLTLANYDNSFEIPKSVLNGVRAITAEATYVAEVAIGASTSSVEDNVYYKINSEEGTQKVFMVSKDKKIQKIYKEENVTQSGKSEVNPLNVYTPISVSASINTDSNKVVNQSNVDVTADQQTIQQNIPFTINFANEGVGSTHYKLTDTSKYNAGYYIKFDFDVENIKINGKTYNKGNKIPAGTWIGLIEGTSPKLTAQAYINTKVQSVSTISEDNASYTVRAVAYNATNRMRLSSTDFEVLSKMKDAKLNTSEDITNICSNISYFAELKNNITLLNRMYDFKITDVKDVSWKSVFRKSTSQTTNTHTGTLYYAGISRWDTESEKVNSIVSRSSSEIGRNPLRIMPIGPYKNTNTSYVSAPKIGYRFSFDLKVTGSYSEDPESETNKKKVEITPSFYYISKDGKTFLSSYDGTAAGIYLFYKNSSGKYVRLGSGSSDDNYKLSFIPNDGYRYITDANKSTLSNKTTELGTLNKITLTKEMSTLSANGSVRTYYGEYKLPNSTIAVKVDENGKYDLNKPLTNGYIGVVFSIDAIENDVVKLSYSKDTKGENTNTSEWEYEGYLGIKNGTNSSDISSTIQLEKGKWAIDGNTYSKIKGTVILYDLDQKAATDYE